MPPQRYLLFCPQFSLSAIPEPSSFSEIHLDSSSALWLLLPFLALLERDSSLINSKFVPRLSPWQFPVYSWDCALVTTVKGNSSVSLSKADRSTHPTYPPSHNQPVAYRYLIWPWIQNDPWKLTLTLLINVTSNPAISNKPFILLMILGSGI